MKTLTLKIAYASMDELMESKIKNKVESALQEFGFEEKALSLLNRKWISKQNFSRKNPE